MKIAILIPSRNRPRQLSAVITALHEMESGENEVFYYVGVDSDEPQPREYEKIIKEFKRGNLTNADNSTIGCIWNYLAKYDKFVKNNCDIYSCMIDDAFPISPHWDKVMAAMVNQGIHAFSWHEVSAPLNVGYPTFTKEWLAKFPQGVLSEHYPYWFIDTEYGEMVHYLTNQGVPVHQQLSIYSKQETTQNLRDLDFWWGFHNATRKLRLIDAFMMIHKWDKVKFEQFKHERKHFIDASSLRDAEFRGAKIEQLEKERGAKGDPSNKYLLAKKKAEAYLQANNLSIWCGLDKCQ